MATKKKNLIPKKIANSYPDKCPCCKKKCIAVFRTWKTKTQRVSCEFLHNTGSNTCKKTYDY